VTFVSSGSAGRSASPAWCLALALALGASLGVAADEVVPPPAFRVGMAWTYQQREEIRGQDAGEVRLEVIAVAADRVTVSAAVPGEPTIEERWDAGGNWEQMGTRGWEWLARLGGASKPITFAPPLALYRFPLQAGKGWVETVRAVDPDTDRKTAVKIFARALAWEEVAVPAGTFRALKVRRLLALEDFEPTRAHTTVTLIDWYAPQVSGPVKRIVDLEHQDTRRPRGDELVQGARLRLELTAFRSAP
jgi:hypothetical protein